MANQDSEIDIPDELMDKLQSFHHTITKMTEVLRPLQALNANSSDHQLDPIDRARLNLACGYALNSLFWMYLNTLGVDPKEHKIKSELDRYKSFMVHIKELTEKRNAPVLDKAAAGRFIRNALWEPKDSEDDASSSQISEVPNKRIKDEIFDSSDHCEKKKRRH